MTIDELKAGDVDMQCARCGAEINDGNAMGAEYDGQYTDVCEECWYNLTNECTLCNERVDESDTSEFILVKAELSTTGDRPPGIYRVISRPFLMCSMIGGDSMTNYAVMFIDKLPEFDAAYELSGPICKTCAKPYAETCKKVYGRGPYKLFSNRRMAKEVAHTRKIILANPDIIRDLECDSVDRGADGNHYPYADATAWNRLRKMYNLPDLPTFHEWLFLEHQGVKVYCTCRFSGRDPGWLSLSPEPRWRAFAGRDGVMTFSPTGLPTAPEYDYETYNSRTISDIKGYVIAAIEQGFIRQDGCYDETGKHTSYH